MRLTYLCQMQVSVFPFTAALFSFWTGCQKAPRFELPPDLGRGLKPADSLRAILTWLSTQKSYEAETLRFHCMYEYIRALISQKPDTLPALTRMLEQWAARSSYPMGRGIANLAWALLWRIQAQYDTAIPVAQMALRLFEVQGRLDYQAKASNLIGVLQTANL